MYFYENEAQRAARQRAERDRARVLSQTERMPDLPMKPTPPTPPEPATTPRCSVCGRSFTHPNQYTIGGTKKKPLYRCRRKACSPRKKRKPQARVQAAQLPKKKLPQRSPRNVFNLFGLL